MAQIVVVGSANIDFVAPVERLPGEGETVLGGDYTLHPGGKGANQAVAAARMGALVSFIGAVGDDEPGEILRESLCGSGIELDGLERLEGTRTGAAFIAVDARGGNQIVVSPGANQAIDAGFVRRAANLIAEAEVMLVQLEVPDEGVLTAVQAATGTVILNPAPARGLSQALLDHVDVLIPNETELGILTGEASPNTVAETAALSRMIVGPDTIITTRGSEGVVICTGKQVIEVSTIAVTSIDSTGAGDTFCGAFAAGLVAGLNTVEAATRAAAAAALSVTRPGAQSSMPLLSEVVDFSG